jgi:hypothetical protein
MIGTTTPIMTNVPVGSKSIAGGFVRRNTMSTVIAPIIAARLSTNVVQS